MSWVEPVTVRLGGDAAVSSSFPSSGHGSCVLHEVTQGAESFWNKAAQKLEIIPQSPYLKSYKKAFWASLLFRVTVVFPFEPIMFQISIYFTFPCQRLCCASQCSREGGTQRQCAVKYVTISEPKVPWQEQNNILNNYMCRLQSPFFPFLQLGYSALTEK